MNLQDNVDISNLMRKHISKGSPKQALLLYEAIRRKGVFFPGWIPLLLKACACVPNFVLGKQLHSESIKFEIIGSGNEVTWIVMMKGYVKRNETEKARDLFERMPLEMKSVKAWAIPEKNSFVWSLMISGYFRAGDVDEASGVFNRVKVRDLVIWNSLITGYAQNGYSDGAIDAFYKMQGEGFEPDAVTVSSVLSACAQSCRLDVGREVHSLINRIGIELNEFVSNALIDMYAKCGDLENATSVFESLSVRSVACWNSMISCLAIHGKGGEALEMFRTMDTKPDEITFLAALSACVHMDTEMAEQVMKIIETAGSVINGDSENHLVLISNLYAHAESWQTAETLRVEMEKRGLEKSTGLSSLVLT
ncbi:hypothetical protein HID58_067355 [Brassica napus]|uniref:Pentatricopeptide repeat-containing protein n=1 Tax=Brassica napus TaxID=3708 RepID=A0ABQ7ZIB1_BRANA|nr:hypothetical protein HID58_067355 [Brassica napus]